MCVCSHLKNVFTVCPSYVREECCTVISVSFSHMYMHIVQLTMCPSYTLHVHVTCCAVDRYVMIVYFRSVCEWSVHGGSTLGQEN